MTDGYSTDPLLRERFKKHFNLQKHFNDRLNQMAKELKELPQMPKSLSLWIESFSKDEKFSLNDYKKHLALKKEYTKIIEKSSNNLSVMKILAIDDLLERIKKTLNNCE